MRVPVTGLIGSPGETKELSAAVPADDFGTAPWGPAGVAVDEPVGLALHLDAVVEGILVRGTLHFAIELACARCLAPQRRRLAVEVSELFVDPARRPPDVEEEPGYELIDDLTAIDLSTMVRDALLIDMPVRVLCDEGCLGLCPVCGTDRNLDDCGHQPDREPDPRWARLADLDLPRE